ncbi:tryptophan-rich sensory protein [Rhizobium azooxidifex]|uniref:Tryptophan-rich sensory protein n=1 Tax=Mycoplana azooxidifex TaxID=1636188 RepID=A0A7W6GLS2_9HYPH|nr:TspO/MBR family protein [Mycoplana azooxidifex]MBB3978169.1 tryptophan-rich sensory protein [Mycoplana azooxidifex]
MNMISFLMLLGFALAAFAAGFTGAVFRPGEWYKRLDKPAWRPPDQLFAPVWTLLYAMIALSGWLVWRAGELSDAALPLTVYTLQLILNAAWSPIFFGLHRVDLAFFEIILLWLSIAATIVLFYPISPGAAVLLLPYLAWVSFASALNFAIWRRNPFAVRF